jgi:hypothetical protein
MIAAKKAAIAAIVVTFAYRDTRTREHRAA